MHRPTATLQPLPWWLLFCNPLRVHTTLLSSLAHTVTLLPTYSNAQGLFPMVFVPWTPWYGHGVLQASRPWYVPGLLFSCVSMCSVLWLWLVCTHLYFCMSACCLTWLTYTLCASSLQLLQNPDSLCMHTCLLYSLISHLYLFCCPLLPFRGMLLDCLPTADQLWAAKTGKLVCHPVGFKKVWNSTWGRRAPFPYLSFLGHSHLALGQNTEFSYILLITLLS